MNWNPGGRPEWTASSTQEEEAWKRSTLRRPRKG